jgi:hypothetical protein
MGRNGNAHPPRYVRIRTVLLGTQLGAQLASRWGLAFGLDPVSTPRETKRDGVAKGERRRMREAFRQALEELDSKPRSAAADPHALQLLRGAAAGPGSARSLSPAELGRLTFRAHKLGRSWASYTHQREAGERQLVSLRDTWTALAFQFSSLIDTQRVTVLGALVEGMALNDNRLTEQKRAYLVRQQQTRPSAFAGFSPDRSALHWLSASAYVVHALEELVDAPLEEKEQLHRLLVVQLGGEQFMFPRLLQLLSRWLASRTEPNWQDNCSLSAA